MVTRELVLTDCISKRSNQSGTELLEDRRRSWLETLTGYYYLILGRKGNI